MLGISLLAITPALAGRRSATVSAAVGRPDVGSQQPSIAWESTSQMNADLDAMVAAGMTWVRADFYWSSIEPQRGRFAWGATDNFVRAATDAVCVCWRCPTTRRAGPATGPTDKYPPRDPRDYATFVQAAAAHYTPMGVHAWEIWNEPNNAMFWAPRADPAAYTTLLKLAGAAIKRADPSATVVTGGMSPASDNGRDVSPLTFLAQIYAHGGRGSFDAVGYHPYSFPYAPMHAAEWNTFYRTPDVHALMTRNGDGAKRVWGTEVGFPTGTGSKAVSEATQAVYITAAINQWTSWSFAGPIMFYTTRDLGNDRRDVNDNMGMVDRSGAPKPVFSSVRRTLQAPRDVHASVVAGGALVTWAPPAWDYGRPITGYRVVATPSGATMTAPGSARSVTFALGSGTTERFSVVPFRGSVPGVASALSTWVTSGGTTRIVPGIGSVTRPRSGTVRMRIPVTLDAPASTAVSVQYRTASFPPTFAARPGRDYEPASGVLTFAPGDTVAFIRVKVHGGNLSPTTSAAFVVLFGNPHGAQMGGYHGLGLGVIRPR